MLRFLLIFSMIFYTLSCYSSSVSEIETNIDVSSEECLKVLEHGNTINIIDGIYPVIVYKGHSYFIQTSYMGATKAYICKTKQKLITN